MSFLDGHEDGCKPLKPCRNCRAVSFLREQLKPAGFSEFLKLIGTEDSLPAVTPVSLDTPLTREMFTHNREWHVMLNLRIETVGDLVKQDEIALRSQPSVGDVTLARIKEAVVKLGHRLGELPFKPRAVA